MGGIFLILNNNHYTLYFSFIVCIFYENTELVLDVGNTQAHGSADARRLCDLLGRRDLHFDLTVFKRMSDHYTAGGDHDEHEVCLLYCLYLIGLISF